MMKQIAIAAAVAFLGTATLVGTPTTAEAGYKGKGWSHGHAKKFHGHAHRRWGHKRFKHYGHKHVYGYRYYKPVYGWGFRHKRYW